MKPLRFVALLMILPLSRPGFPAVSPRVFVTEVGATQEQVLPRSQRGL
jgi:hypothetical protein